jgi:hypothetical protein
MRFPAVDFFLASCDQNLGPHWPSWAAMCAPVAPVAGKERLMADAAVAVPAGPRAASRPLAAPRRRAWPRGAPQPDPSLHMGHPTAQLCHATFSGYYTHTSFIYSNRSLSFKKKMQRCQLDCFGQCFPSTDTCIFLHSDRMRSRIFTHESGGLLDSARPA